MLDLDRRTYLKGVTGTAVLAGGVAGLSGVAGARPNQRTVAASHAPIDDHWMTTLPTAHALLCETDMNGQYDIEMHLDGNPEGTQCANGDSTPDEDRSGVVHVTSNGHRTTDYAHGIVNLRDRLPQPLTLQSIHDGIDINFDYYEGPHNEAAAPDEVFVLFEGAVRSLDDIAQELYGQDFANASRETKLEIAHRYLEQYNGSYQPLDEIATDPFPEGFGDLSDATVMTAAHVFRAQFRKGLEKLTHTEIDADRFSTAQTRSLYRSQLAVPSLAEPEYTLDETSRRFYHVPYSDLSADSKVHVTNQYRDQFHVATHSLDEIASIFGKSFEQLSDGTKDFVETIFRQQFTDDKLTAREVRLLFEDRRNMDDASAFAAELELAFLAQYVGAEQRRKFLAFEHFDDGVDPDPVSEECTMDNKRFWTLNVTDELFDGRTWRDTELSEADLMSGDAVINAARRLRDEGLGFDDPISRYGSDAQVVAIGFGAGNTREPTVKDIYFDALRLNDGRDGSPLGSHEFDFPAAVPANVSFERRRGGEIIARVELQQEELGVNVDDVNGESIRLNRFGAVAPPMEMGVMPVSVNATSERISMRFETGDVASLLRGSRRVIVSGKLDGDQYVSFVAVGTLDLSGGPPGDDGGGPPGNNGPPGDNGNGPPASTTTSNDQFFQTVLRLFGLS